MSVDRLERQAGPKARPRRRRRVQTADRSRAATGRRPDRRPRRSNSTSARSRTGGRGEACGRAAGQFLAWCGARGVGLRAIAPLHVAAYIRTHPAPVPTVKQHLAAIRALCDWLVVHQFAAREPGRVGPRPEARSLTSGTLRTLLIRQEDRCAGCGASHGSTARRTRSAASSSWASPRPPSPKITGVSRTALYSFMSTRGLRPAP